MQMIKKIILSIPLVLILIFSFCLVSSAEENKVGIVTCDVLNIRELPGTENKILRQVTHGERLQILESSEEWYKIKYNDDIGWVHSDYITVKVEPIGIGTINADYVNIRTEGSLSSKVITMRSSGARFEVYDKQGDWYKIMLEDGTYGWVYGQYISFREGTETSRGGQDVRDNNSGGHSSLGEKIVQYAKQYLGVKYVYGGSSPKGFDCSGFVQYVFKNFGINLERVAANQAKHGTKVDKANLRIGDLVFFDTNGGMNSIEHVGIYIGGGNFIHASSASGVRQVTISDLTSGYYSKTYMGARRYISD
ncbi:MAG TPA: SH3 domain-containing protein [Clostridiaceae bacterium]|nr:SH3 domain-containing protein [Clostridiaceae bacterium]